MIHPAGRPISDRDLSREKKFGAGAPLADALFPRCNLGKAVRRTTLSN
jgi:hypothetical protein